MEGILLAGFAIGLLTLIFSELPFANLIYCLALPYCLTWDQLGYMTFLLLLSMAGGGIYRKVK